MDKIIDCLSNYIEALNSEGGVTEEGKKAVIEELAAALSMPID